MDTVSKRNGEIPVNDIQAEILEYRQQMERQFTFNRVIERYAYAHEVLPYIQYRREPELDEFCKELEAASERSAFYSCKDLRGVKVLPQHFEFVSFRRSQMRGFDASGCNFFDVGFDNCDLDEAWLTKADFSFGGITNSTLRSAHLAGAKFYNTCLEGVDLTGADLSGADFWETKLHSVKLDGACLAGANFHDCDLNGSSLNGADLSGAVIDKATRKTNWMLDLRRKRNPDEV